MDFEVGLSLKKGEETSVPSVSDDSRKSSGMEDKGLLRRVEKGGCFKDQTGGC